MNPRVMGLLKTLKESDISLFFFKMQGPALFFFVSVLIAQPFFYYQNFDTHSPTIDFDVTTDRMVYDVGDVVTINGFLKLDYFYSDINVQIYIFNWGEASTELLVETLVRLCLYDSANSTTGGQFNGCVKNQENMESMSLWRK